MQYILTTNHRASQWRGLTLIAVSSALFAVIVAFGEPWGLPVALRVVLTAFAGVGLAAGQLIRGSRA